CDGGVGVARIDVAGVLALEPRFTLLGAVVDIALGQEQRFGCLAEFGTDNPGLDQAGFGAIAAGWRGCVTLRHVTSIVATCERPQKNRPGNVQQAGITEVPGLFSDLFNVAASRPAQITTG